MEDIIKGSYYVFVAICVLCTVWNFIKNIIVQRSNRKKTDTYKIGDVGYYIIEEKDRFFECEIVGILEKKLLIHLTNLTIAECENCTMWRTRSSDIIIGKDQFKLKGEIENG